MYLNKIFVAIRSHGDVNGEMLKTAADDDGGWQGGDLDCSDHMALTAIKQENDDVLEVEVVEAGPSGFHCMGNLQGVEQKMASPHFHEVICRVLVMTDVVMNGLLHKQN